MIQSVWVELNYSFNLTGVQQSLDPEGNSDRCKVVNMMEKPRNAEILRLHFKHKEDKLRERIRVQAVASQVLAKEMGRLEEEGRENIVFRLADMSFPTSECDDNEKKLPTAFEQFDYTVNESETKRELLSTLEKSSPAGEVAIGISCGERQGSRVILRSFHDRISKEPRGETNYHQLKTVGRAKSTFRSHKEWLDAMANDPEILVNLTSDEVSKTSKRKFN